MLSNGREIVMRLILIGPPGSGKGTQAEQLSERFSLKHVSTGDLFRRAVAEGTPTGKKITSTLEAGELVPDPLVNEVVSQVFHQPERPERFLLDGYPRTLQQAQTFHQLLEGLALPLTHVLLMIADDEEIVQRIAGRWVCSDPQCPGTYHVKSNPPKRAGVCDIDGAPLKQRHDDQEGTVRHRLEVYHQQTEGVVPFYRERGLVTEIDAVGPIGDVTERIVQALKIEAGTKC